MSSENASRRPKPLVWRLLVWVLTAGFVVVALAAAALPILPRVMGWQTMIISTGSMEPTFPVGTMTLVQPIDPSDVEVGTPLVFRSPESPMETVTHRVIEVVDIEGQGYFRTQGDANDTPDQGLVPPQDVVGHVTFDLPYLGWAVDRLQRDPTLMVALIAIPASLIVGGELRTIHGQIRHRRPRTPRVPAGGSS